MTERSPLPKSPRDVVITGFGTVSPLGLDTKETWANMIAGKSGIVEYDTGHPKVNVAGVIKNFDPHKFLEHKESRINHRSIHLAIGATQEALEMANLVDGDKVLLSPKEKKRTGVIIGTGFGAAFAIVEVHKTVSDPKQGPTRVFPKTALGFLPDRQNDVATMKWGFRGPTYSVTAACATGGTAVMSAARTIRTGEAEIMLAGSTEAPVDSPESFAAFGQMGALALTINKPGTDKPYPPEEVSRPLDRDAHGFVISEGASVVVLESREHAEARGATIYARLVSGAETADAGHPTTPSGEGAYDAMHLALQRGGLTPAEIGLFNLHATATIVGDPVEIAAILRLFENFNQIIGRNNYFTANKSQAGHSLGGAQSFALIVSLMAIRDGIVPPILNLTNPIAGVEKLNAFPHSVYTKIDIAMTNGFGFGGKCVSIIAANDNI